MRRYRFVTPARTGKWYPDLDTAKRFASQIGAGFFDTGTGRFVAYVDTRLEVKGQEIAEGRRSAGSGRLSPAMQVVAAEGLGEGGKSTL